LNTDQNMRDLLIATNNPGKIEEYRHLLENIPFKIRTPVEIGLNLEVTETGKTFEENASLKAMAFAKASGLLSLADDSGLEVDALNGEPGIRSRRYAGDHASDEERIKFLLDKLKDITWEKRTARFRCVIAIALPEGKIELCSGECSGLIAFQPRGNLGFGYDPIFYFPELDKTLAELPMEIKNRVSHRGNAAREAAKILNRLAQSGKDP